MLLSAFYQRLTNKIVYNNNNNTFYSLDFFTNVHFVSVLIMILLLMREWDSPSHNVYMPWHLGDPLQLGRNQNTHNDIYNEYFMRICPRSICISN